jgi:adenylate cyclase
MKNRIWLFQIPIVALFTFLFWVGEAGVQGELHNEFLRESVFPSVRSIQGIFTNAKFRIRGPIDAHKNKVVVVDIDDASIDAHGRWPWHRDKIALLINRLFEFGVNSVGLDIVFSEQDQRVPEAVREVLTSGGLKEEDIFHFETDGHLIGAIQAHKDRLVLGWTSSVTCQPRYTPEGCVYSNDELNRDEMNKLAAFAIPSSFDPRFSLENTPLIYNRDPILNVDYFQRNSAHLGFFNAYPDRDGIIRRTSLVQLIDKNVMPALALEMAAVIRGKGLEVTVDQDGKISRLAFAGDANPLPVSPLGAMEINFRGPGHTFEYVSAVSLMSPKEYEVDQSGQRRLLASTSDDKELKAKLAGANAIIGLSAIGVYDMRAFPFDENVPGVEGHANILDNLLSRDMLTRGSQGNITLLILFMTIGTLLFAYVTERLESIPALGLFLACAAALTFGDLYLFKCNINLNTSLLGIELVVVFAFVLAAKYVLEERNKKFMKTAMGMYVAPALVEQLAENPDRLVLGGEKKDLSILFSDIRSFTTFSEKMDAKQLSTFLNDYLTIMTDIITVECNGTIDKYIGDAVMAFWGAPLDQPDHAALAAQAATRMMQALRANRARWKAEYGIDVAIGIGINSGSVSVGNMGSKSKFNYTVIGDHVNLASRLEGMTKYYGCGTLTTRGTFDHIAQAGKPLPPHRVLDRSKPKGKNTAVELIEILDRDCVPEGLKLFEDGRKLYADREWDRAITRFREAESLLRQSGDAHDGPCDMFVKRCEKFKADPPPADWDGSWKMDEK